MIKRILLGGGVALMVAVLGCGDSDNAPPAPTSTPTLTLSLTPPATPTKTPTPSGTVKPLFNWGYPQYSQYNNGQHVGTTLYQQDPLCKERLTFYECALVNAKVEENSTNNPTMASSAMTSSDLCTSAITDQAPSYCVPADVCNPTQQNPAWAPGQASTDNLAWQLFIALNWPANPNQPGYPDTTKQLGAADPSGNGNAQTVWLDYPTPADLFGVPSPCSGPTLPMSSKLSDSFLARNASPGLLGALGSSAGKGGGVLIDQNGNVVYEDIRVNRTEWEFIVNQNNYWQTGASLAALKPDLTRDYNAPPGQTAGSFPAAIVGANGTAGDVGTTEIKTAWKQLTAAEVASGTYYTRTFNLYDKFAPNGQQCSQHAMGLIGMHIVYMPALFGNPEWLWVTFEHRLNVPTSGINDGATQFSLYNPNCTPVKTAAECAAFDPDRDPRQEFKCCPNLSFYNSSAAVPALPADRVPNQITRLTNPSVSTILPTKCTDFYTQAITKFFGTSNVWQNYFLVSAQWPLRGSSTNFPFYQPPVQANFPCTLRNSTMETFSVASTPPSMTGCSANTDNPFCRPCNGDCVASADAASTACPGGNDSTSQFTTADCLGCHATYAGQNSSFIFTHRPCCVRRDSALPNTCGTLLGKDVCSANPACTWDAADPTCASG